MTTIATAHGLCFCAGPWRAISGLPARVHDRAHIPNLMCERLEDQRPRWLQRLRAKELGRRELGR